MNTSNAFGFLAFGWVMKMLPLWSPAWFPPTDSDGFNAQAIWLHAMGWSEIAVGGAYLLRHSLAPLVWTWAAFQLPRGALEMQPVAIRFSA